jgi:hypothetical protein
MPEAPERRRRLRVYGLLVVGVLVFLLAGAALLTMPGSSYRGEVEVTDEADLHLAEELSRDVEMLAGTIGERNVFRPDALDEAVVWIESELRRAGLEPRRRSYQVRGVECHNIEVEIPGRERPDEIVIIGAHYDSVMGSPGANDNGSGVTALLALARRLAQGDPPARTLRLVFFVNEEPPFFTTPDMGSLVYARRSGERSEDIRGMLSLETIGYFDDEPGSQRYPLGLLRWFYPDRGDFIGFVGNLRSRSLLRSAIRAFRTEARVPSEGAALPGFVPGVGWSDHWSFWQEGYAAIMITDTAPFRYPYYHTERDSPDKLDYGRLALVVRGLEKVVDTLVRP